MKTTGPRSKIDPKRTLATTSPKVFAKHQDARRRTILIVEGISKPETRFIDPKDFVNLEIDSRYQRGRTNEVNDLIHVLKSGGKVYDPVTLCRRKGGDTLYIVDGHQRFWAHHDCGMAMPALIYQSENWQAEALLFQAMNMRRNLTADTVVKSHQGPGAEMLRKAAEDENHLLFNRIHFGAPGRRQYKAAQVIRAMLAVSRDVIPSGGVSLVCGRLDHAIENDPYAAVRCNALLRLLPRIFPPGMAMPKMLAMIAVARVAENRWRGKKPSDPINLLPSQAVCARLARINWSHYILSFAMTHIHNVVAEVGKRWPEDEQRWMAS